ncbi:lytic transglycosylase domain-containing protein [Burkholderia sp. Ax-1724]|uniref:lytic transglycosylase domain-containing protein n=1 Tax=Burkholderia sp. Ax-1724 TaxID=2608336 RepID=UPI001421D1E2|nr:lytic transglycosylase domain-containing protein [Burkholderia sp. Ax-1724]NIF56040.1 lytic transglycosylase domain-containing protein [Burkholderia sp. Ax-1724]
MSLDFMSLAQQCAPQIAPDTMAAIVRTESGFNPYAIGVVHGRLLRQPSSAAEAMATMRTLETGGWNFSVGLAQVNRANWSTYGLTMENVLEPCRNLAAGAAILQGCVVMARNRQLHAKAGSQVDVQTALRAGLSCYASGDFLTGYRTGYVQRVVDIALGQSSPVPTVPAITPIPVVRIDSPTPTHSPRSASVIRQRLRQDRHGPTVVPPVMDQQREQDSSAVVF